MKRFTTCGIIGLLAIQAFAAKVDSTVNSDSALVHNLSGQVPASFEATAYYDSSLFSFQKYLIRTMRGGLASPLPNITYQFQDKTGFRWGGELQDVSRLEQPVCYYRSRTPYTAIKLVLSSKKDQYFDLLHTQNIKKNWNVAVGLKRMSGEGFYLRQNASLSQLWLSSNYLSSNGRYGFRIEGSSLLIKRDENGGLVNDTLWAENIFANKKLFGVRLSSARSRSKALSAEATQFLYFGPHIPTSSVDSSGYRKISRRGYLSYTFGVHSDWFVYSDGEPQGGYYQDIYLDSTTTLDSNHVLGYENKLSVGTLGEGRSGWLRKLNSSFSFSQRYERFFQQLSDTVLQNLSAGAVIENVSDATHPFNSFLFKANYVFSGPNQGDRFIYARIGHILSSKAGALSMELENRSAVPSFLFERHISNNFFWANTLENEQEVNTALIYSLTRYKLGFRLSYGLLSDQVYMDASFLPKQDNSTFKVWSARLNKDIAIGHFNMTNAVLYQQSGNEDVLRIPNLVLEHSLFYSGYWFKKAMQVQLGADIFYFSAYKADAYMPALRIFYKQDSIEVGNYPYVDLFFNFKIKRVRVFVKADHVASGLLGANYFLVPHYPGNDRQLKVGISWRFFD